MSNPNPLGITEVVLRDAHQSLFATRMRIEDMLPIGAKLDEVGFWSLETWGGATFDACIRFLGEDPWERLRRLKAAMPKTRQQMLLRGQNLLGYRHYADDLVEAFVDRAAENGMDVFRIFDAVNDVRNLETSVRAVLKTGKHAQGTMSYTISPAHKVGDWIEMGARLQDLGCHSICIKDMAGLLKPFVAEELVSRLKEVCEIPIAVHSHATTGMSIATAVKAVEAGVDMVDTAISSMSMTYSHSSTESIVAIFQETDRNTGLDLILLEEIAAYFRIVRKKYAKFEGSLRGVDSRILVAQVPGGMLSNMENQLREQGASERLDEVLEEIPKVRQDLGFIPLVTPTSQIVGTQAVINVLTGERYKSITKETMGILKGEYGATAAPVNKDLQARVLQSGEEPITCRPADLLKPELEKLTAELKDIAHEKSLRLVKDEVDDVLIFAQFPQVGLKFLQNRGNPAAFEPVPTGEAETRPQAVGADKRDRSGGPEAYRVEVNGKAYDVRVTPGGAVSQVTAATGGSTEKSQTAPAGASGQGRVVPAPLAGNVCKLKVKQGQAVETGEVVVILEAMKMETEVRSPAGGVVSELRVNEGDTVHVGDPLLILA